MSDAIPDRLRQAERENERRQQQQAEMEAAIDALHRRVLELEAAVGLMRGTLERAREDETEDAPAVMTFVKPNAPR